MAMEAFADVQDCVSRLRSSLVGHEIVRVEYVSPASSSEDEDSSAAYDIVRTGVEFRDTARDYLCGDLADGRGMRGLANGPGAR